MSDRKVPILVYHHVYNEGAPDLTQATLGTGAGIIGVDAFRQQMAHLRDQGWTAVSTTRIVDWLTNGTDLPDKALALHFDNGWLDTVTVALPLLEDLGMPATCFPITDAIESATEGKSTAVRTLTEGMVEKPFVTWDQVLELVDSGWEIGAHTATHCKIGEVQETDGDEAVLREAEDANEVFARRLGYIPEHFAYPSGSRNEQTDRLLADYYRSLRLWHFEWPVHWTFTDAATSPQAVDCQNIDMRVSFTDFQRIFTAAETD